MYAVIFLFLKSPLHYAKEALSYFYFRTPFPVFCPHAWLVQSGSCVCGLRTSRLCVFLYFLLKILGRIANKWKAEAILCSFVAFLYATRHKTDSIFFLITLSKIKTWILWPELGQM